MENKLSIDPERLPVLLAFGQAVRDFRKAQGFSQESFAYYCGLDRSYMGGVERGERNITLANVERIILSLQLKPSEFFAALDGYFSHLSMQGHVIQLRAFTPRAHALPNQHKPSL